MRIGMRTIKTVISVFFSMVTAGSLSLLYWPSLGMMVKRTKRRISMQFGRFRLGMRTIKSALAVFLCILFFHLTQRGIPT